ncbi:PcfJ domain-containing protein [Veillonella sp.]|uniref:PcfJ domain-containing protein n=1 Tax=Veillonella sp. TaxID=1926307 RepID=UPI0025F505CD|nr:PcfJ domain-containing protein [Veillonella sp.]
MERLEKYTGYPIKYTHHMINTRGTRFFGDDLLRRLILKTYAPDAPLNVVDTKLRNNTVMPHTWETYRTVFIETQKGTPYIDAVEAKLVGQPSKAKRKAIMSDARYVEAIHIAEGMTDNKDYQDALMAAIRPYLGLDYLYRYLTDYIANRSPRNALQFLARYESADDGWRMVADTARSYADIIDKAAMWAQKIKPSDMHDELANIVKKERDKDIPLKDNTALEVHVAGYDFITPKTSHELIDLGEALHNCVGSYKKSVAEGRCAIVAAVKNGRPVVCIEIKGDAIVQAKLNNNKSVYTATDEEVRRALDQYMDVKGLRDVSRDLRSSN